MLSRAQLANNLQTCQDAQQIWRSCITDLQRVSEIDPKLATMATCAATFLQCQLLIDKVIYWSHDRWLMSHDKSVVGVSPCLKFYYSLNF